MHGLRLNHESPKTPMNDFISPPFRRSRVRARWDAGLPALCTVAQLADPSVPELISGLGYDCIWIDLEHSPMSSETAVHLMRAARQGDTDILARPAKGEFMRMGRLLEAGANGILYPRCESAEEAREVVRWAKFAPLGERGYAGGNPDAGYGTPDIAAYVEAANRDTFICVQIESPSALRHASSIAAIEGVDVLFFGPGDFSVLSGHPGNASHPSVLAACEEVCAAALSAGKRFGTVTADKDDVRRLLAMGATLLHHGCDMRILRDAYIDMRVYLAEMGFSFGRGGAPAHRRVNNVNNGNGNMLSSAMPATAQR
jgi:4-hydroxy-2-oxoheptanedioate aldolase